MRRLGGQRLHHKATPRAPSGAACVCVFVCICLKGAPFGRPRQRRAHRSHPSVGGSTGDPFAGPPPAPGSCRSGTAVLHTVRRCCTSDDTVVSPPAPDCKMLPDCKPRCVANRARSAPAVRGRTIVCVRWRQRWTDACCAYERPWAATPARWTPAVRGPRRVRARQSQAKAATRQPMNDTGCVLASLYACFESNAVLACRIVKRHTHDRVYLAREL